MRGEQLEQMVEHGEAGRDPRAPGTAERDTRLQPGPLVACLHRSNEGIAAR
jgi:hypothetical protein